MYFKSIASFVLVLLSFQVCFGQEKSVRPDINDSFNNLTAEELSKFVERFEKEGREVFDLRKEIIDACQLRPAMSIADIGAGTGLFTQLMSPSVAELYAVDINQKFLDHIEANCKKEGIKNVKTILCDQTSCGLEEASVDLVFICDTYHHFEFPYKTMRSIRRALKPGGVVVLVEFDRIEGESSKWILNHVRAGRDTFSHEIEMAGFKEALLIDDIFKTSYLKKYKLDDRKTDAGHTTDSLEEVRQGLESGAAVLIDVREKKEWDEGHLKAASLLPLSKIMEMEMGEDAEGLSKALPNDQIVYTHCKKGGRAVVAAEKLAGKGFDVRPLPQGYDELVGNGFEANEN